MAYPIHHMTTTEAAINNLRAAYDARRLAKNHATARAITKAEKVIWNLWVANPTDARLLEILNAYGICFA